MKDLGLGEMKMFNVLKKVNHIVIHVSSGEKEIRTTTGKLSGSWLKISKLRITLGRKKIFVPILGSLFSPKENEWKKESSICSDFFCRIKEKPKDSYC